jgi:uncharacterized membrane protein YjgN (DUF898 family)
MEAAVQTAPGAPATGAGIQSFTRVPFEFTGKAGEYFKIWIVNILLTILTLGIYSAWAKVRRKRYFYGNTSLQGAPFEYLAEPMQILKGRLIAFGLFVVYVVANNFAPPLAGVLALGFVVLFPWLVIRALTFNARYSAYRNIRFDFKSGYGKALGVHIGLPILSVFTIGIAYPAYSYHRSKFVVAQSGYGTTPFTFNATMGNFYVLYLLAMLILLGGMLLVGAIGAALSVLPKMASAAAAEPNPAFTVLSSFALMLAMALVFLTVRAYIETATANLVWNNVVSGANRFASTLDTKVMLWLYLSNAAAILFSLGLLIPWAQIRMTRYRLSQLKLLAAGDLDGFIAKEQQAVHLSTTARRRRKKRYSCNFTPRASS